MDLFNKDKIMLAKVQEAYEKGFKEGKKVGFEAGYQESTPSNWVIKEFDDIQAKTEAKMKENLATNLFGWDFSQEEEPKKSDDDTFQAVADILKNLRSMDDREPDA